MLSPPILLAPGTAKSHVLALLFEDSRDDAAHRSPNSKTACEVAANAIDLDYGCVFTPAVVQNLQRNNTLDQLQRLIRRDRSRARRFLRLPTHAFALSSSCRWSPPL